VNKTSSKFKEWILPTIGILSLGYTFGIDACREHNIRVTTTAADQATILQLQKDLEAVKAKQESSFVPRAEFDRAINDLHDDMRRSAVLNALSMNRPTKSRGLTEPYLGMPASSPAEVGMKPKSEGHSALTK
jgi:hypothetical protein